MAVLVVLAGSWYGYRKLSRPACGTPVSLTVGAAPEVAQVLQAAASDWAATAKVGGRCVTVEVAAADPADVAAVLAGPQAAALVGVGQASGKVKAPEVWVPDSSLWLQRLRAAKPGSVPDQVPSVARSPVVLAMPEPVAATFGWPQAKLTWTALFQKVTSDTKVHIGIVDPTRDSSGLSGLLALAATAQAVGGANATQASTAALRALAANRSVLREDLLKKFPRASDPQTLASALSVAPLSEQAVLAYNAAQPPVRLAPLAVEPAPIALDFPFAVVAGLSAEKNAAAAALSAQLTGDAFKDRLTAVGLQSPDGAAKPVADPASIDKLLSAWSAITLPARMLAVIDVSGSMLEPVPTAGNATRMAVTLEAARRGMALFDESWAVGVWIFSTFLDGQKDYKQLVPIGPLTTQRTTLVQTLGTIKPKPTGDTGLYDTILAGYKAVQAGWDPGRINSLVVMTDGVNDDPTGITLDQLLAELQKTVDPAKPINVILIGIGTSVSQPDMEKITKATGGGTFLAPDPAKIGEIFIQAISLRTQAPR
jgi:hypothetical protein